MAKQKKQQQQQLSPQNYIRQKSRNLPLHQSLINDDWKENGLANILIARKHTNGNYTVCTYLVDLKLLGVKDTIYLFNIDQERYEELTDTYFGDASAYKEIEYPLAHNIIFSALAFAEDYGFKPHKDFTSVTEHFLEEDDDRIELIDIECGQNGRPTYVNGPYDSQAKINQVLLQLEKTAGPGNFDFVYMGDDEDYYDDEDYEEEGEDMEDEEWDDAEDVTEEEKK